MWHRVDSRLNTSQRCALAVVQANSTACLSKGTHHSLSLGAFHTHLKHHVQFWTLQYKQDTINPSEFSGGLPRCSGGQSTCCVRRGWGCPDTEVLQKMGGTEMCSRRTGDINCNSRGFDLTQREDLSLWRQSNTGTGTERLRNLWNVKDLMNKALVWIWCWSRYEQQVWLDTSWGPFQPGLFYDMDLDPREH